MHVSLRFDGGVATGRSRSPAAAGAPPNAKRLYPTSRAVWCALVPPPPRPFKGARGDEARQRQSPKAGALGKRGMFMASTLVQVSPASQMLLSQQ